MEQAQTNTFSDNTNGRAPHHTDAEPHVDGESTDALSDQTNADSVPPNALRLEQPTPGANSRQADLKQQIEALIFSSDEALPVKTIRVALGDETLTDLDIEQLIDSLNQDYDSTGRTFRIHHIAQGYRFLTEKQFHSTIQKLLQPKLQRKLSQAALETLAIIAYKQPISKPEIEAIRGTNADYVIRVLLEKNLIEVSGRGEGIGKPLLYGTTKEFLDYFNLGSLSDLPKPREIDELMREGETQEFVTAQLNARLRVELETDGTTAEKTASQEHASDDAE